jgi:hypothetical protein
MLKGAKTLDLEPNRIQRKMLRREERKPLRVCGSAREFRLNVR